MRRFIKMISDIFFPSECHTCGRGIPSGRALCEACTSKFLREMFFRCPKCSLTADKCKCGTDRAKDFHSAAKTEIGNQKSFSLTFYLSKKDRTDDRITEGMIYALKEYGYNAEFFAEHLSLGLKNFFEKNGESLEEWRITYPPRSEKKKAEYGFDQSEKIAERMSKILGIPCEKTMKRLAGKEQKKLNESERAENADKTLILLSGRVKSGGKYIVIDDIFTTGATMSAAVRLLTFAGAEKVFPVTVAKTLYY